MENIEKKIIGIVEDILMIDLDTENDMDISFETLGIDSFLFMRVLVELENKFGFSFGTEFLKEGVFENLRSLVAYVSEKVDEKSNG